MPSNQRDLFTGERVEPSTSPRRRRNAAVDMSGPAAVSVNARIDQLTEQMRHVEETLRVLAAGIVELRELVKARKTIKESYDTKEVAEILGIAPK